jgi:hypothetical protein
MGSGRTSPRLRAIAVLTLASMVVLAVLIVLSVLGMLGTPRDPGPDGSGAPGGGTELNVPDPATPATGTPTDTPATDSPDPAASAAVETLTIVWTDGNVQLDAVAPLTSAPWVSAVTLTRSAQTGLTGSVDADGVPRDVLPDGFRIPVTLTAVEPVGWARLVGPSLTQDELLLLGRLEPGRVLLSESSARLRGIGEGARVDLAGARDLEVVGVVSDRATSGSEFLVHVDDEALTWLGGRESLLVRHLPDRIEELEAIVETSGQDDLRVHRQHDTERDGPRVQLILGHVALKERFGEFAFRLVLNQREIVIDRAFVDEWIVSEQLPVIGTVRCHRLIMDDLRAAVDEMIAAGHEDWLSPRRYAGCYHPRRIGFGRENLSRHAWGVAIDLNVDLDLPGGGPVPPDDLIEIMGRHGFRWGGDFTTPDNHHFEWLGAAAAVRPERG